MAHVGGQLQAEFMARVRGCDPARCLVVPVDVGKSAAMALVADHYGEVVVAPFEFDRPRPGSGCWLPRWPGPMPPGERRSCGSASKPPVIITGRWWPVCGPRVSRWSS